MTNACAVSSAQPVITRKQLTLDIARQEKNIFTKANKAWESLKKFLENTDEKYVILFKWSQNTIFTEEVLKAILENKADEKNLVRQSWDWIEKKEKFFKS